MMRQGQRDEFRNRSPSADVDCRWIDCAYHSAPVSAKISPGRRSGSGGKAGLNGNDVACHGGYRVRYRRTFGEGLALDPFRNSDTSSKILPNGQRIHRPRALTVIKFDPGKLHTAMPLGEL